MLAASAPDFRNGGAGGPVFQTSISTLFPGQFGTGHTVHLGAVLDHPQGLHVHEEAARPPAHQYGLEVHPDMIIYRPVIGGGVGAERAVSMVGLDGGGDSLHHMGLPSHDPRHGHRTDDVMEP